MFQSVGRAVYIRQMRAAPTPDRLINFPSSCTSSKALLLCLAVICAFERILLAHVTRLTNLPLASSVFISLSWRSPGRPALSRYDTFNGAANHTWCLWCMGQWQLAGLLSVLAATGRFPDCAWLVCCYGQLANHRIQSAVTRQGQLRLEY